MPGGRELTPAELEALEKSERERTWRAILMYYVLTEIKKVQDREIAMAYQMGLATGEFVGSMLAMIRADQIVEKLMEKEAGFLSGMEMVKELAVMEPEESPFRKFHEAVENEPSVARKEEALAECLTEAPDYVVKNTKEEMARRQSVTEPSPVETVKQLQFNMRLNYQMSFLRQAMRPNLFKELCDVLKENGVQMDAEKDFMGIAESQVRKEKLAVAYESLKGKTTGQSGRFHKMVNGLQKYVNSEEEPSKAEKDALAMTLAEFVVKDCSPLNRGADPECEHAALYSLKALVGDEQFGQFIDKVNESPLRRVKLNADDYSAAPKMTMDQPGLQAQPERVLRPDNPFPVG